VTWTPLSRSKGQRSRSPGRFALGRVGASGGCSGQRGNVLAVKNCCYVAACSAAQGASAPTGGGEGRGIPCRPPAYSLLDLATALIDLLPASLLRMTPQLCSIKLHHHASFHPIVIIVSSHVDLSFLISKLTSRSLYTFTFIPLITCACHRLSGARLARERTVGLDDQTERT